MDDFPYGVPPRPPEGSGASAPKPPGTLSYDELEYARPPVVSYERPEPQRPVYGYQPSSSTPWLGIWALVGSLLLWPLGFILGIPAVLKARSTSARVLGILALLFAALGLVLSFFIVPAVMQALEEQGLISGGSASSAPARVVVDANLALANGDCDKFTAATSDGFRAQLGVGSCQDFDALSASLPESTDGRVAVVSSSITGEIAFVQTREKDAYGAPLDVQYSLQRDTSGSWVIVSMSLL